jgi:hypothetical protein
MHLVPSASEMIDPIDRGRAAVIGDKAESHVVGELERVRNPLGIVDIAGE